MREDMWSDACGETPEAFRLRVRDTLAALPERRAPLRLRRRGARVLLAACLAVVLLTGTAFATGFFGLADVTVADQFAPEDGERRDIVSLQGYPESREYLAAAEWMAFLADYDRDGALLRAVGNDPTGLEEEYGLYNVYTRDMADRLDEITEEYGLTLHRSLETFSDEESLYALAETGEFLRECAFAAGYVYDDGSFQFEGSSVPAGEQVFEYQFGRAVKGVFSEVTLNVGDAAGYEEWEYVTGCGVTVHLSLGESKCVVFADLPTAFVYVNVLGGSAGGGDFMAQPVTRASLEAFAELFDLTRLG